MCVCFSQGAGFEAKLAATSLDQGDLNHSHTIGRWRRTFFLTLAFAIPAVLLAFLPGVHWKYVFPGVSVRDILLFILSTVVQVLYVMPAENTLHVCHGLCSRMLN